MIYTVGNQFPTKRDITSEQPATASRKFADGFCSYNKRDFLKNYENPLKTHTAGDIQPISYYENPKIYKHVTMWKKINVGGQAS